MLNYGASMPPPPDRRLVRFGIFELDLSAGELRKSGTKLRLQGQPFLVLALLLDRAGDVVTRDELRQKLWPSDTFVDFDHSLNTAINKLREVLGDSAICSTLPSAPTGLTATASSSSIIGLTWTAVTPPANCSINSYNVYSSTTSGFTPSSSNLVASGVTTPSYSNTGLAASTTYYYAVEAVDLYGASAPSAQASAETSPAASCDSVPPTGPTNLTATAASSSSISLSWTAAPANPMEMCSIGAFHRSFTGVSSGSSSS